MTNRLPVVAAFFAGAFLVAMAVVACGYGDAPQMTLAEKKAMLKLAGINKVVAEQLAEIKFGGQTISDDKNAEGNKGVIWNYGQNFGGLNANALARGWKTGADSLDRHSTGVGMFGKWGTKEDFMKSTDRVEAGKDDETCKDDETWVDAGGYGCSVYAENPHVCPYAVSLAGADGTSADEKCTCACSCLVTDTCPSLPED
jgi:hypothetical protein